MIAAVTNYYNPSQNKIKWDNFCRFRDNFPPSVPLYVVEAAFGKDLFTLPPDENIIHVRCADLIWQQYTLINHGILSLPDKYDKVAWIDADIVVNKDWLQIEDLLDDHKIAQTFSTVTMISKGLDTGEERRSVAAVALENSQYEWNTELSSCLDLSAKYASGFSWGVQRELVEKYRIYDYWITGSCDTALCIALWGDFDNPFFDRMNNQMRSHYMEWAENILKYVDGSIGCSSAHVKHLWHGHRNYKKRWICLKDFDPYADVRLKEGCLEWCSNKPKLHDCCRKMCLKYDMEFKPYL